MKHLLTIGLIAGLTGVVAEAQTMRLVPRGGTGNEISIPPGGSVTIDVFIEDVPDDQVRGYQATLNASATGGVVGSVDHDGNVPVIDEGNVDYIFSGLSTSGVGSAGPDPLIVNALQNPADAVAVSSAVYCGEFVYTASGDASGDFTIDITGAGTDPANSDSFIVNEDNTALAFDTESATVHILPLMTLIPRDGSGNSINAAPGSSVTIDVFIQSSAPGAVRGYQATLPLSASGGNSGAVDHDGNTPVIDEGNADYIFAGLDTSGTGSIDPLPLVVNAVQDPLDSVAVTAARYCGEFVFTVSNDADGTFTIDVVDPGSDPETAQSFIADTDNFALDFATAGAEIIVSTPPKIVHNGYIGDTLPPTGYIDPRDYSVNLGPMLSATIEFSEAVNDCGGGALSTANFVMTETGGATPPDVVGVTDLGGNVFEVEWDRGITAEEWTTIRVDNVCNGSGEPILNLGDLGPGATEPDRVDIGRLEVDVDQSGIVQPFDLLEFRILVNGGSENLFLLDIDRNDLIQPFDLLQFRIIVNGGANGNDINNVQP